MAPQPDTARTHYHTYPVAHPGCSNAKQFYSNTSLMWSTKFQNHVKT